MTNTKELIDIINADSLVEVKQHLGNVLALLGATELPGARFCDDFHACQHWGDKLIELYIVEPDWSDCTGCQLK